MFSLLKYNIISIIFGYFYKELINKKMKKKFFFYLTKTKQNVFYEILDRTEIELNNKNFVKKNKIIKNKPFEISSLNFHSIIKEDV